MKLTKSQKVATFPTTTVFTDGKLSGERRKHAWERPCRPTEDPSGWLWEKDKAREKFENDATVTDGVVRWNSNNSVPPADCLGDWYDLGLLSDAELERSTAAREEDTERFVAEYRRQRANRKLSAEERFEMRAAFGPGATVVDVLTGQKFKV